MRNLILIDGGPASGKNTLGELLIQMFNNAGEKAILLDLDTYVEKYNSTWIWENDELREKDRVNARVDIAKNIDKYLKQDYTTVIIGERFFKKEDVANFIQRMKTISPIYLYHLDIPFSLREKRLHQRGPHSLIDLAKDQKDRDKISDWPGYVYNNINSPKIDAESLMLLIKEKKGLVSLNK